MRYRFNEYVLDVDTRQLMSGSDCVHLEPQVYRVLEYLIANRSRVVTRSELLRMVWGDEFVTDSALTSRVKSARRAVADSGVRQGTIKTVRSVGYRFVAEVEELLAVGSEPSPGSTNNGLSAARDCLSEIVAAFPPRLDAECGGESADAVSDESVGHKLPVGRTPLVGREEDIQQVSGLVAEHRLVTLLGIGGTGKTRLAMAVAAELADKFADGVWFVDLVPAAGSDEAIEAILATTGLHVVGGNLVLALARFIADRDMLIVLDNCEHLTNDIAEILDVLLEETRSPRFLTTSREPLQLIDERHMHIAPLAVSEDPGSPAVQLFVAAAARVEVRLDEDDVPTVALVCGQLDGLPLSIELAAAQLRQLSLTDLSSRLDRRFELLALRRGGRGQRHASLQAVLVDSWGLLDEQEKSLLLQLAAFPASFNPEDVEAVSKDLDVGVAVLTLGGLVDRSLVARVDGNHRLLETVKLFVRQQWAKGGGAEAHFGRHTRWVLDHLSTYPIQEWYSSYELADWASTHHEDHRTIEDRFVADGDVTGLTKLFSRLTNTYVLAIGPEASALIDRVGRYLKELVLSDHQRGVLHLVAAGAGLPARRPADIAAHSAQAARLLGEHGGAEELAAALVVQSWMMAFSDLDAAFEVLKEAFDMAERAGADVIADMALCYMANHLVLADRLDEAIAMLESVRARVGDRPRDAAGIYYTSIATATYIVRDPNMARTLGEEYATQTPNREWGPLVLRAVSVAASGDIAATRDLLTQSVSSLHNTATDDGLPDLLIPLATLAWALGDTSRARGLLTVVRYSERPTQSFPMTIVFRQVRGEVGLETDNPLEKVSIEEICTEAMSWLDNLDDRPVMGEVGPEVFSAMPDDQDNWVRD